MQPQINLTLLLVIKLSIFAVYDDTGCDKNTKRKKLPSNDHNKQKKDLSEVNGLTIFHARQGIISCSCFSDLNDRDSSQSSIEKSSSSSKQQQGEQEK